MDITAPTGSTETNATPAQNATQAAFSDAGEQFDTFLKLLTAQVRNQDPLAPLDSTQFVEQLATFTSLEQQVRTNSLLESLSEEVSTLGENLVSVTQEDKNSK